EKEAIRELSLILVASVPTAIIGLLIKKKFSHILTDPWIVVFCLFFTGAILFLSSRFSKTQRETIGYGQAFIIGLSQGIAVLPGISRSGTTIVCGLSLGLSPERSARFSFFISLPAITGAALLELKDANEAIQWTHLGLGMLVSFLAGLFAISWMIRLTQRGQLKSFSYYVVSLALLFVFLLTSGLGKGVL
ncbi:MAG: undecaprenyl-diphosphate phosphatase, partial [Pseudomonadota bacterium]